MPTLVKFRVHPITGDLFAYFPQLKIAFKVYYSHIGQHSVCAKEYEQESRPATIEEYTPLKKELESIGYTLKVCK